MILLEHFSSIFGAGRFCLQVCTCIKTVTVVGAAAEETGAMRDGEVTGMVGGSDKVGPASVELKVGRPKAKIRGGGSGAIIDMEEVTTW